MSASAGSAPVVAMSLNILDTIGGWGVSAMDFINELTATVKARRDMGAPLSEINMTINSPGGSVFDALAMYNALRATGLTINATVLGVAASAATVVLMAADKISMPKNTFLMVHNPMNGIYGNAEELRTVADTLETIGESLIATYAARTGQTPEVITAMLNKATWMTADEALALGFCNEVTPLMAVAAEYDVSNFSESVQEAFNRAVAMNPVAEATAEELEAAALAATAAAQAEALAAQAAATIVIMGTPLAISIRAAMDKAGLGEYVAVVVLDSAVMSVENAQMVISEMLEIQALCEVAGAPEAFAEMANKRTNLVDARNSLISLRATASDNSNINGNNPNPDNNVVVSCNINPVAIYAARKPKEK